MRRHDVSRGDLGLVSIAFHTLPVTDHEQMFLSVAAYLQSLTCRRQDLGLYINVAGHIRCAEVVLIEERNTVCVAIRWYQNSGECKICK